MKKLHVSELTDGEFSAVFLAAAEEAVERAVRAGHEVPTITHPETIADLKMKLKKNEYNEILNRYVSNAKSINRVVKDKTVKSEKHNHKSA